MVNHWWLNFLIFLAFFSNVRTAYNRDWRQPVGWGGWDVRWQKAQSVHSWSSHDANRQPHNGPCHIRRAQKCSVRNLGPCHLISIIPGMTLEGWENSLHKTRPVNIRMIHWGWINIECTYLKTVAIKFNSVLVKLCTWAFA